MMYVKYIAACLLLSFVILSCNVRDKEKTEIGAVQKTEVLPTTVQLIDSVYDFGTIAEGENVEYSFRFKNTGTNPLIVSHVSASCGCTVPEKPEAPVMPGETGYIKVKFNSDKRPGQASKSVVVQSNANPGFPDLLIKGNVTSKTTN